MYLPVLYQDANDLHFHYLFEYNTLFKQNIV